MKTAFWGLGIFIIGILGILLVSLFGNITVTNQLNYTTLKNAVDASMNDSISETYFDAGFCLCTDIPMSSGKFVFTDKSQYDLVDIKYVDGKETCPSTRKNCKVLFGEYRIDRKTFVESVIRRFAEMANNNKNYQVIVQDVNEYPPKVSVRIVSFDDEFVPTDRESGGYSIVNQIDAIIETEGAQILDQPTNNNKKKLVCPTPTPTPTPTPEPETQSYDPGPSVPSSNSSSSNSGSSKAKPKSGNGCFLKGTKIATIFGDKDIDKIKVGDYVLTYNEYLQTNEFKKVTYVFKFDDLDEELYSIKTDDSVLKLTGHHGVYVKRGDAYFYIAAMELEVGDVVMYSNGEYHMIETIEHHKINEDVYNLETDSNHNFYVGDKRILVHNMQVGKEEKTGSHSLVGR